MTTPNQKSCAEIAREIVDADMNPYVLEHKFQEALEAERKVAEEWKEQCRATAEGGANNIKLIADLRQKLDVAVDTLEELSQDAYPLSIFTPMTSKNWKELDDFLKTKGWRIDRLSADYGRII